MKKVILAVLLLPLLICANEIEKWSITVYGSAQIEVDAEQATIVFGVSEKGASIEEAYQNMRSVVNKVTRDLLKLDIKESDIIISNFTSGDNYWGNSAFFKADNFKASSRVTIDNLEVSQVEPVILSLGKNKIDKILQLSYSLKADAKYKKEAREMALLAAREKAIEMSAALDGSIGNAIAIEEIPKASDVGYSVLAERAMGRGPFNAMSSYEVASRPEINSLYPEKISIEQHVRVVFHLIQ